MVYCTSLFVAIYRRVSAARFDLRTEAKSRIFHLSDISADDPDRNAVVGVVLDQPRGNFGQSSAR